MSQIDFLPLSDYHEYSEPDMQRRSEEFLEQIVRRRSVRHFSTRPVPRSVIENCLLAASSAPSGANMQPWHFVVISDPEIKSRLRAAAEKEEHEFYHRRAPEEWLAALAPLGTDEDKPFLEDAPFVIAVFAQTHGETPDGKKIKHYYVNESVGIATGFLITAVHNAGLACLTHTPSPMRFLNTLLDRPRSERPYLLLVVGYPAEDARVPRLPRKSLDQAATFV